MKIELKSWMTGNVLFSLETEALKLCVEAAVKSGANLYGANLCGADLYGASLHGAKLHGAKLYGAKLCGADLRGADLRGADLRGADLCGVDLRGADLCGADLRDADLRDADLCGADLCGADLCDAKGLEKFPIQIFGHKHFMITTEKGLFAIGCEIHSFEEWKELAEELGGENGYSPLDVEIYKLHIEHAERVSRLLWNKSKSEVTE